MVHAAGESSTGDLPEGTIAIVLAAQNEEHLLQIADNLRNNQVPHKLIREPDPPWDGALMAIGVKPNNKRLLRKHFSNLPLLR